MYKFDLHYFQALLYLPVRPHAQYLCNPPWKKTRKKEEHQWTQFHSNYASKSASNYEWQLLWTKIQLYCDFRLSRLCQGFGCKNEYDETFEELYRPWLCSFNRLAHFWKKYDKAFVAYLLINVQQITVGNCHEKTCI